MMEKSKNPAGGLSDTANKLSNLQSKKSLFERQKAENEAKRVREEKETAAVYEDFVKSFDHDDDNDELLAAVGHNGSGRGGFRGGRGGSFPGGGGGSLGKRHFSAWGGKNSGPGSLPANSGTRNSGPGRLGPVSSPAGASRGQKRPFNEYGRDRDLDRERHHGMFSYNDNDNDRTSSAVSSSLDAAAAFRTDGDEDHKTMVEKTAPKPTLHLSSLPPGTSPAFIKSLIPSSAMTVENVRILPGNSAGQSSAGRRSTSAIVTVPTDTPAADIDTLVSQLQNKYLGFGFYLSISRHLSSAALGAGGVTAPTSSSINQPFGARSVPQYTNLSRGAPPPGLGGHRAGFAPPASYTSSTPYSQRGRDPPTQVIVMPPSDLKQLKLIHLTLEALLSHGPEFEALLMSRREIQRDEKWAWLWDARSSGGVYYRWRLWAISTGAGQEGSGGRSRRGNVAQFVFENSSPWIPPDTGLKFEYTTKLAELIEDEAYDSSDEEDYDDDARNQRRRRADQLAEGMAGGGGAGDPAAVDADGIGYLNPLAKAKLTHVLARLPESNTKLRKGDVARVTAFAIEHAGEGADEVASIITANVRRPLCFTAANPDRAQHQPPSTATARPAAAEETDELVKASPAASTDKKDTTPASLVGLYLISDILMSSTTSGVRHAWRYRALFESALKVQKTFEYLGRVERELGWGRLKAEKWKRSVQSLLGMWEGWCVFPQASQEAFVEGFANPPGGSGKSEAEAGLEGEQKKFKRNSKEGAGGKWKTVEEGAALLDTEMPDVRGPPALDETAELDGVPMTDADEDDEDVLMGTDEGDLDGEPMLDSSDEDAVPLPQQQDTEPDEATHGIQNPTRELNPNAADAADNAPSTQGRSHISPPLAAAAKPKRVLPRPKAVDMFADESDED